MKIPVPPIDVTLPPEVRIGFCEGWRAGYRLGFRDGNPGRVKTAKKAAASARNGKLGGRPKKMK